MLPPTLGGPFATRWPVDDLAPDTTRIYYQVKVSFLKPSKTSAWSEPWATHTKNICVIPNFQEEPPIDMFGSRWHCTQKTKGVRKGFFSSQSGTLTATVLQPNPIHILGAGTEEYNCIHTSATVKLCFIAKGNVNPPELQKIYSELQADTFYRITPWSDYPPWDLEDSFNRNGGHIFSSNLPLLKMSISSVLWATTSQSINSQSNSRQSNSNCVELSDQSDGFTGHGRYYTASISVPIILPKSKLFVPTFHTCFISRTYQLNLSMSYRQSIGSPIVSKLSLQVPIQVTA